MQAEAHIQRNVEHAKPWKQFICQHTKLRSENINLCYRLIFKELCFFRLSCFIYKYVLMIRKGEMKHSAIVLHYIFKIIQCFLSIDYLVFSIELVNVT